MSIEEVAKRIGRHRNVVASFLRGRSWPYRTTLTKLDAALELEPGTLLAIGEGRWEVEHTEQEADTSVTQTDDQPPELVLFEGLVHSLDPAVWQELDDTEQQAALAEAQAAFLRAVLRIRRDRDD